MTIPIELILTVTLSALCGALIPAIALWLQSKQQRRELSLRHEELLYQRRLEIAIEVSQTCYKYFTASHALRTADDDDQKEYYLKKLFELGKQIEEHEPVISFLFPAATLSAFKEYWRTVDHIRTSKEVHWTAVGSRLDEAYAKFISSMRNDLGITSAELNLSKTLTKST